MSRCKMHRAVAAAGGLHLGRRVGDHAEAREHRRATRDDGRGGVAIASGSAAPRSARFWPLVKLLAAAVKRYPERNRRRRGLLDRRRTDVGVMSLAA